MNTLADFGRLLAQKTWNKDIVIWVGEVRLVQEAAQTAGQPISVVELDLLDLLDQSSLPENDSDIAVALRTALRAELRKRPSGTQDRQLLIVRSAPLLTRYSIGLRDFFDWFVGDHALVVLVLEGVLASDKQLPPEIELRPDFLLQSLYRADHAKHVFSAP